MAVKKQDVSKYIDEEKQAFESEYFSDTVNDLFNNVAKTSKMDPKAYKHVAVNDLDIEYIPFGVTALDRGLRGGLPRGTVVELYGPPGGGKSYLGCYKAVASVTQNYGNAVVFDIEKAFNIERARDLGAVTKRIVLVPQYDTGEQVLEAVENLLNDKAARQKGKVPTKFADLIVIDSIAALGSKNEMEADHIGDINDEKAGTKKKPASKAMMMSEFSSRLQSAIGNSSGYWAEDMKGIFRQNNSWYSFRPEDDEIPEDLMKEIKAVVKIRQDNCGVKDLKHPDLWKAIWYGQDRRDRFEKYLRLLDAICDEGQAESVREAVENRDYPAFRKIRNEIKEIVEEKDSEKAEDILERLRLILVHLQEGRKMLPPTPKVIADFEKTIKGYLYDYQRPKGLPVVHFNPGPTVILINQVRTGNIGSYTGTTVERPGGIAYKHTSGTILSVTPMTSKTKGEVRTQNGSEIAGWKSLVYIEKARFGSSPKNTFEITIPFSATPLDEFDEFMSDCQKMELWDFTRKFYVLPMGDEGNIKTKDENEWFQELYDRGLAYLQSVLNYSEDQMRPIFEALAKRLETEDSEVIEDYEDSDIIEETNIIEEESEY